MKVLKIPVKMSIVFKPYHTLYVSFISNNVLIKIKIIDINFRWLINSRGYYQNLNRSVSKVDEHL